MGLRTAILTSPEILSDLAWAARQRYADGERLLTNGHHAGAIYLLGLAAEMWLKLASAKLIGLGPATPVAALLGPVKTWMSVNAPAVPAESYHSVAFWAHHLALRRSTAGNPLPALVAGQLHHHIVRRLFEDWKIDLRYRQVAVVSTDAWRVYNDVTWLGRNWDLLWR